MTLSKILVTIVFQLIIIEINPKDLKKVTDILEKNSVHFDELGKIIDKYIIVNQMTKVTIDEIKSYNTTWLNNYMGS